MNHNLIAMSLYPLLLSVILLGSIACSSNLNQVQKKEYKSIVVSYQDLATKTGNKILISGGNAFDSFIATTLVQYVIGEGVTSAAGPLQAVLYDSKSKEVLFLDGGFSNVADPEGRWNSKTPSSGKAIVIPGAIRALEALSKRFGKLSFSDCIKPAYEIARDGFIVDSFYAKSLLIKAELLKKSEYGRKTFFKNGQPIKAGETIRLPEVAHFFERLIEEGADYMYQGAWAKELVKLVQQSGGKMKLSDLSSYQAIWDKPMKVSYHGFDIYGPSGRSFGGAWAAFALKVLENWRPNPDTHYTDSVDDLETLIRVSREVENEAWIYKAVTLDDKIFVEDKLNEHGKIVWKRIQAKINSADIQPQGTHSYHVIVADEEGNVITGTNTIQAMPWAEGVFIEGIPLNNAGSLADGLYYGSSGGRRLSAMSMHLAFKGSQLRYATGAFHSSLMPAELQFLINLIDYKKNAVDATSLPRFGNAIIGKIPLTNAISPRISLDIVNTLKKRGVELETATRQNHLDTGLGGVVIIHEDGTKEGAFAPLLQR